MWEQHLVGGKIGLTRANGFDPSLPSILLIHGSGGYKELYNHQIIGLRGRANVAAIDLPGHGQTAGPGFRQVEPYAQWLADFLAAGPVRPVVLGHSLGGAVALQLGLDHPELASGLVLMGSGGRLRVMPQFLQGLKENFAATIQGGLGFAYAPDADAAMVAEGVRKMLQTPAELVWGDFSACDAFDVTPRLGQIDLPALALVGSEDRMTPPKYSQYLAQHMPRCAFKQIDGGGHMLNIEKPAEVNQALIEFLAQF
ncbi:alpha/beta hydrolase fold protein [Desulfarculus baarsii DSM 2075]|uniref:Alpha/beta hydrolase fold protein n=1 Tax=Desulfarculus baarsii (strain ATCC 33931 / DSM 2075 / LMG 7858 / VKM B-1802 / 2st14) TaxID=644282 RepID=E1QKN0_DESB2|nr:alpha/beta hydrolase [Desulfarculus baarsii]ADK86239.1 alpha/beta hydrolase fold protein [Desulfarculus baarsii DSM 2075]